MATIQNLQGTMHHSIHMPHLHITHSYNHISPPSNQQELQISPPHYDATQTTCIAIGGLVMLQEEHVKL